jgi:hypothetical protein
MLEHFGNVSIFESAMALLLILGIDLALSAIHSFQEWTGKGGPLWRYFGAIAGIEIPDGLGLIGFTIGLTIGLWALAFVGMAGVPVGGPSISAVALGALIGARVSDSFVSHLMLARSGFRPNPGLASARFYLVEAAFLVFAFWRGLSAHPVAAVIGIAAGALFFVAVLPALRLSRNIFIAWRRDPWISGQPRPQWVKLIS